MARGWESKSVEAQQHEAFGLHSSAASARQADASSHRPFSREEAARRAQLATLALARSRAEADLRSATASAHRSMLERAIAHLDRQIAELNHS